MRGQHLIDAARRAFAAEGIEVPMSAVSRAAGVGIATLFRRFPTREDLINAVFAGTMDAYVDAVTTALADPDPWHGFTGYVEAACAIQAADRGFAEVLTMTFPAATHLEEQRARACHGFLELIDRAKAAGRL
jgi:AcrR family transcriptional regulator